MIRFEHNGHLIGTGGNGGALHAAKFADNGGVICFGYCIPRSFNDGQDIVPTFGSIPTLLKRNDDISIPIKSRPGSSKSQSAKAFRVKKYVARMSVSNNLKSKVITGELDGVIFGQSNSVPTFLCRKLIHEVEVFFKIL